MVANRNKAFSLVELSVVLVIIGLITGGVMTGKSLIRSANLHSIITDLTTYKTAVDAFQDQYNSIPGDLFNATYYWGKDNAACPAHTGTAAANGVCNGDGDGILLLDWGVGAGSTQEAFQFWRHLSLAGMIEGNYTGLSGSIGWAHAVAGVNVPTTRISSVALAARHTAASVTPAHFLLPDDQPGNHFTVGKTHSAVGWAQDAFLKPKEAGNIDTKLDDGKPAKGKVLAPDWANCTTATVRTNLDADYNLANNTIQCGLWMRW